VIKELVKRNAACIKSLTPKVYYGGEKSKRFDWEDKWQKDFQNYNDIGDGFMSHPDGFNIYKDGQLYDIKDRYDNDVRTDKDLIEIVETIGKEASGRFARLEVVEIPDDVNWEIQEYDGYESIHEIHRS